MNSQNEGELFSPPRQFIAPQTDRKSRKTPQPRTNSGNASSLESRESINRLQAERSALSKQVFGRGTNKSPKLVQSARSNKVQSSLGLNEKMKKAMMGKAANKPK